MHFQFDKYQYLIICIIQLAIRVILCFLLFCKYSTPVSIQIRIVFPFDNINILVLQCCNSPGNIFFTKLLKISRRRCFIFYCSSTRFLTNTSRSVRNASVVFFRRYYTSNVSYISSDYDSHFRRLSDRLSMYFISI